MIVDTILSEGRHTSFLISMCRLIQWQLMNAAERMRWSAFFKDLEFRFSAMQSNYPTLNIAMIEFLYSSKLIFQLFPLLQN